RRPPHRAANGTRPASRRHWLRQPSAAAATRQEEQRTSVGLPDSIRLSTRIDGALGPARRENSQSVRTGRSNETTWLRRREDEMEGRSIDLGWTHTAAEQVFQMFDYSIGPIIRPHR